MDRKKGNWIDDLQHTGKITLKDSVGYLDRMISGGCTNERQFLQTPKRRDFNKFNKIQKFTPNNNNNNNKDSSQAKLPRVDVDDANWIAERKKRFPKVSARCGDTAENEINDQPVHSDETSQPYDDVSSYKFKPNRFSEITTKNTRKKTLFERLIEMDKDATA